MAGIGRHAAAAPQLEGKTNSQATKTSSPDIPDGDLDLSDLWPSPLQQAVETDTTALQPALSVTGGNGGAGTPSFTGDPSFDGDTFEVNGQQDIVIPYFQMADQIRLDFEDGHQLQGPAEQLTKAAIKKVSAPKRVKTTPATAVDIGRFHGGAFWNGGNSILNANSFVIAGAPVPNPAYHSNNYGATAGFAPFLPWRTKPSRRDFVKLSYSGQSQPNFQLTQTTGVSGAADWVHGAQILRFGGSLSRTEFNLFGGTNATGALVFTGGYTQIEGSATNNPVSSTGSSFADFLLGLPTQTRIESAYQKAYTRQTNWGGYLRDDWKALPTLTILAGLRYDYYSPYVELHNRFSTLDYNSDFSDIAPVQPGDVGPISGRSYPRSLIHPDRSNFSPHIGLAWQARKTTAVRSGYGIYYTLAQYGTFIQKLAYQPPFAHVEINGNVPHFFTAFTLQAPFGNSADFGNYSIHQNYKLPYVQVWYLDLQQALPLDLILDVGYAGAKGTKLDIVRAPGPVNILPFASAYFDYEDSSAFSNFNSLVVRIRHEFKRDLALSATYAYSHSIDNASSTNAGIPVVAQNPNDPLAEESNSSFDIRHQVTGSFLYQLPFGPQKAFFGRPSLASHALAGLSIAGFFTVATGVPLTPYVSASVAEVERGTHGSVRPNRVPGTSIGAGGGHLDHWFNTAAFSPVFAAGQLYGTASRFSIPGPGTENVNLSVSRNIHFSETENLLLRASASNALNTVQYSDVDTQVGSSTFGYITGVQPMRQFTFLVQFGF